MHKQRGPTNRTGRPACSPRGEAGRPAGFSLIELVVDIAILATLLVVLFLLVDPITQINKARDATRKNDLTQLQTTLDTYYNDHGCYPTELPFGGEWRDGSTVYMREVPQDGNCRSNPSSCYLYQVDTSSGCPQWNILFAKQDKIAPTSCTLDQVASYCLPPNYDPSWACTMSGSVDCQFVAANPVILPVSPTGSGNSSGSPTAQPSSSPLDSCPQSARHYACTGGPISRCNAVPQGTGTFCSTNCDGSC